MKITAIETFPIMVDRPHLFVTVATDDGLVGVGESGLTWQERAVAASVEQFGELLVGEDALRSEHLWQLMARAGFFPADLVASAAISAIDLALWDIKGKALGQPVYNLLGCLTRERIACYPHNVGEDDPAALADDVRRTVTEGWRFARWGLPLGGEHFEPAEAVRAGLRALEAVRAEFGDALELCVDIHTRLDPPDALRFCRAAEDAAPFFIEDALRAERPQAYRRLREHTAVPLAAGEQWHGKWGFQAAIEEELIDYARIDLCLAGGLTEALKIARWAETHWIQLAPHNPLGPGLLGCRRAPVARFHQRRRARNGRPARLRADRRVPAANTVRSWSRAAHRRARLGHRVRRRRRPPLSRTATRLRPHPPPPRWSIHQLVGR